MITLKDVKIWTRWKSISKMNEKQLEYYNKYKNKHREETIRLEEKLIELNKRYDNYNNIIVSPMFMPIRNINVPDKIIVLNINIMKTWNFINYNNYKKIYKNIM